MQRQFLRRIDKKTDYKQRLALLKSGIPRIVVRKSTSNIHVQIIKYERNGDRTVLEDVSSNLKKLGWKAHCSNIPAGYLIGYKVGKNALIIGIKEAVADIGLQNSTKENIIYAVLKGIKDSGIDINIGDAVPDDAKIKGSHISSYAKLLKKDKNIFEKQFSLYLKNNMDPENIEKHFDEIKEKIQKMV